jgi:hypothetical protein
MKNWDMNNIIAIGLVIMGISAVWGWIFLSIKTGTSSGTEIPIGIISGLTGVLTGKKLAEYQMVNKSQVSEALGRVATVATEGQKIVNAVESIKDLGKKG